MVKTNNLRELIYKKGLTQREVCEKAGLSMRGLHNYMNGIREMPVSTAMKIAKILEVNWWKLYERN